MMIKVAVYLEEQNKLLLHMIIREEYCARDINKYQIFSGCSHITLQGDDPSSAISRQDRSFTSSLLVDGGKRRTYIK